MYALALRAYDNSWESTSACKWVPKPLTSVVLDPGSGAQICQRILCHCEWNCALYLLGLTHKTHCWTIKYICGCLAFSGMNNVCGHTKNVAFVYSNTPECASPNFDTCIRQVN